ncbi:MAG: type 1 glutamine amidotransferase [Spirochaetota bacterium]
MRVHCLQHVAFEGLASMESYFQKKGYSISYTHLYKGESLPSVEEFDWLIIMGGPMGVFDTQTHPWLLQEKRFIESALSTAKVILGICLGAQLLADVLGAKVYQNDHKEIGWFPVFPSLELYKTAVQPVFTKELQVFHWHGDTFDLPRGSYHLVASEACKNQGFILEDRIVGLQFHMETTMESAKALIENCQDELDDSRFVQSAETMLGNITNFSTCNEYMNLLLKTLEKKNS